MTFDATDFRTRYNDMLTDLGTVLFERTNEIHGMGIAAIGRLNMFNLGSPGLAKSQLANQFMDRIGGTQDGDMFRIQINRTTVPEELFGPVSVTGLKNDQYVRNPKNRLPQARVALLDELFKGSSVILNTALKALNEHEWDNNGESLPLPLWFAICPSNECPSDAEFSAIRDRLPLSYRSELIRSDDKFLAMLKMATERHTFGPTKQFVTVEEIEQAQQDVRAVTVSDQAFDALLELRRLLREEGIVPSDRRFVKAVDVLRAEAWMAGRYEVKIEDFRILKHVMWLLPEQIREVERCVLELGNPIDKEAAECLEEIESLATAFFKIDREAATAEERIRNGIEYHAKAKPIGKRLEDLAKTAEMKGHQCDALDEAMHHLRTLSQRLSSAFEVGG